MSRSDRWRVLLLAACLALPLLPVGAEAAAAGAPPATAAAPLEVAGLQADVDILEQAYTQLHPGLYRYNTPAQMAAHFAALRKALDHPQTRGEAYLAFSRFAATIRCGHTYANFYNQKDEIARDVLQTPTRVPFHFRWIGRRMVVTQNFSGDATLVPGTEVLAIDGIAVPTILRQMLDIARADGGNDGKRLTILEVTGSDRYNAFDVYLPLLFPAIGTRQRLTVRAPGDRAERELVVRALTDAERVSHASVPADGNAAAWSVRYTPEGVAILRMPGWALYNSKWDWQRWLQATFEDFARRGTPALVIDLRDNEGGVDVGQQLIAHFITTPLRLPGYERRTRYRQTPVALRPYLDTWDPSFNDWGAAATDLGNGFYRLQREGELPEGELVAPKAPHFDKPVYVLVDASNSSATFEFTTAAHRAGLVKLVGQTTGGNLRGINGGAFFFLRLPNSKIELDLPLVGQFPPTPQPDGGVAPDIAVPRTVEDVQRGVDAELAAALAAIAARRK
jgi:C-terminal processing protease CtpA/Prc